MSALNRLRSDVRPSRRQSPVAALAVIALLFALVMPSPIVSPAVTAQTPVHTFADASSPGLPNVVQPAVSMPLDQFIAPFGMGWTITQSGDGGNGTPGQDHTCSNATYIMNCGALDVGTPIRTPIYAIADGTVSATFTPANGCTGGTLFGNHIIIRHDAHGSTPQMYSHYAHLCEIIVAPNYPVVQGQLIGYSGNTGNSTAAHLHFGVARLKSGTTDQFEAVSLVNFPGVSPLHPENPDNCDGTLNCGTFAGVPEVFEGANYSGVSQAFTGNDPALPIQPFDKRVANDTITSLRVPDGYRLILYRDANFQDPSEHFDGPTTIPSLDPPYPVLSGQTSSLQVIHACFLPSAAHAAVSAHACSPPPPPPPPSSGGITVTSAYPHGDTFTRGQSFNPEVVVQTSGVSLDCTQDFLKSVDGNQYGTGPDQGCVSLGNNQYKFHFYTAMMAPTNPGSYHSQWQVFHYPSLIGPVIDLPFTVAQPHTDGVQLCVDPNYGSCTQPFTYTSDSTCIDLGGLAKQVSSLRFLGSYSAGSGSVYHAIMYNDASCQTYLARYIGQDQSQLGGLDNTFASMRIERHTAPAYVTVCSDQNGGGECHTYPYSDDNQCIPFPELHDNVSSLSFSGTYDGSQFHAVMYHDMGCQVFLARYYNQGIGSLGLLDNQFNSMRIEKHPCYPTAYEAAFFTEPNWMGQCIVWPVVDKPNATEFQIPNDSIQSVRIGAYVQAVVYQNDNYQGTSETLTHDDFDLSDNVIGAKTISSFRIIQAPPLAPSAPSPADGGAYNQGQDVALFWAASVYATQYSGEWWGADNIHHPFDWQSGRSADIGVLPVGTYLWHVQARNAQGESGYGPIWVFSIQTPTAKGAPSFGTGNDGDLTVGSGQTAYTDNVRTTLSGYAAQGQPTLSVADATGFSVGDEALIIQSYGGSTTAGQYEFATVSGIAGNQLTLTQPLTHGYNVGTVPSTSCPNGFSGQYFANNAFSGSPQYTQCDSAITFDWAGGNPANLPAGGFSIRWTGTFSFVAGMYRFNITSLNPANLSIDGQPVSVDDPIVAGAGCCTATAKFVELTAGNHIIEFDYVSPGGHGNVSLGISVASAVQVIRVPHYRTVTVQDLGWIQAHPWDGSTGGVIAFRASQQLNVTYAGHIGSSATGYRGGRVASYNQGYQGESYTGSGGSSITDNGGSGGGAKTNANDRHGSAGGGGYGSPGADGTVEAEPDVYMGVGGRSYGNADLSTLNFGSGGGSGDDISGGGGGADGGKGGGIVFIAAPIFNVTGEIQSVGGNGGRGSSGSHGGGGGGAGGSILLQGNTITIGQPLIAYGGTGSQGINVPTRGGDGGVGRIRVEYCGTFTGQSNPVASTKQLACAPAPAVTSLDQAQGSIAGGTVVTMTGTGFVTGATVSFGGSAATNVTVGSSTTLTAMSPAHGAGLVDIVVTNPDGQLTTLTGAFRYVSVTATHFTITGPATGTAGISVTMTVTALDATENTAAAYMGTIHFTSSDVLAALPGDYTFVAADNGVHTFSVTLKGAGTQTVSARDTSAGGPSGLGPITIAAGSPSLLLVSGFPSPQTAGVAGNVTVSATDAFGNAASSYTGTVRITSSDPQAVLPGGYTFVPGDNGVHTLPSAVTLKTARVQSITATDTSTSTITGSQNGISVAAAGAATLVVTSYPSPTAAGASNVFSVQAKDGFGNTAPSYAGTVHFTSTDAQATLPANYLFTEADGGTHIFAATFTTAGTQTLTVTDIATASITGVQSGILIVAGALSSAVVATGNNQSAIVNRAYGSQLAVTVKDAAGNTVSGAAVTFAAPGSGARGTFGTNATATVSSNSSGVATAPAFTAGTVAGVYTVAVILPGGQTFNLFTLTNTPDVADHFLLAGAAATQAGGTVAITVTAQDAYGNTAVGYRGAARFSSTDGQAALPGDYAFTAGDSGIHAYTSGVMLKTAGNRVVTVTDTTTNSVTGILAVAVSAAPASTIVAGASSSPQSAAISAAFATPLTATVSDAYGNPVSGVTVTFTPPGSGAAGTFAGGGNPTAITNTSGIATTPIFTANTTAGTYIITASATGVGTSATFSLTNLPGPPGAITVTAGGTQSTTVSSTFNTALAVIVRDAGNNLVPNVTVTFVAPGNGASGVFNGGSFTVNAMTNASGVAIAPTFTANTTAGAYMVSAGAVGVATPAIFSLTNTPGNATTIAITGLPNPTLAGATANFTVTARDIFGNTATGYRGTVRFTTSDTTGTKPADYAFASGDSGAHPFTATFKTVGSQTLTVADTAGGAISGTQSLQVNPGPAAAVVVAKFPSPVAINTPAGFTVILRDAYGNTASSYTGTMHFTSTDAQAILPATYRFNGADQGTHLFTATLRTSGTQTITATDTTASSLTGSQTNITVGPIVVGLSPSSGDAVGGTVVTIKGAGFASGATVHFDTLVGINVTVVDATTITVITPAHATGAVDVKVTTGGATVTLPSAFTYGQTSPAPVARPGPPIGVTGGPTPAPVPPPRSSRP